MAHIKPCPTCWNTTLEAGSAAGCPACHALIWAALAAAETVNRETGAAGRRAELRRRVYRKIANSAAEEVPEVELFARFEGDSR